MKDSFLLNRCFRSRYRKAASTRKRERSSDRSGKTTLILMAIERDTSQADITMA
jgi:hypothetical protein